MKPLSKSTLLAAMIISLAILGCKKDEEPVVPVTPVTPGLSSLNSLYAHKGAQSQYFTINNNAIQTITGAHGTMITFNANTFVTMAGAPVTGNVTIELKEILDKKTMLLSNVSTNAELYPSGPKEPLVSGGEFYVHATQGNAQLKLAPGQQYSTFLPSATPATQGMSLFDGTATTDGILWSANADSGSAVYAQIAPQGYFTVCDSLDWGNADRFLNAPNYTTVSLNLSGTFDPNQIKAFTWYDNVKVVWSFWDAFNSTTNVYSDSHTATGVSIHLIVISVKDGVLYTAMIPATLMPNAVYNLTMTATDEDTFANSLNSLP